MPWQLNRSLSVATSLLILSLYFFSGLSSSETLIFFFRGKEVAVIRDDFIMLRQEFWDQDDVLVKTLKALEIEEMDGRTVASVIRMGKEDTPGEWTEVRNAVVKFDLDLPANLFTLSNLRNPRE